MLIFTKCFVKFIVTKCCSCFLSSCSAFFVFLIMCLFQKIERREKFDHAVRERERQRIEEYQRKWSHREEADFFRTVSTFGVEFDRLVTCVFCNKLRSYRLLYIDSSLYYRIFFKLLL